MKFVYQSFKVLTRRQLTLIMSLSVYFDQDDKLLYILYIYIQYEQFACCLQLIGINLPTKFSSFLKRILTKSETKKKYTHNWFAREMKPIDRTSSFKELLFCCWDLKYSLVSIIWISALRSGLQCVMHVLHQLSIFFIFHIEKRYQNISNGFYCPNCSNVRQRRLDVLIMHDITNHIMILQSKLRWIDSKLLTCDGTCYLWSWELANVFVSTNTLCYINIFKNFRQIT